MDIAFFIFLLVSSAFFSGSETAFLSLGKFKLRQIEEKDTAKSKRVVSLLSNPHKLLITILIGNTFVNIAASAIFAHIFFRIIGEGGVILSIVIMTLILLIFGEVAPKRFSLRNNEKVSYLASIPLAFIERIFSPLRIILSAISNSIVKGLGFKLSSDHSKITEQDVRTILSEGKKKGVFKKKEKDMIDSILEFKELDVADIMTPRIDIAALDVTKTREDLEKYIKDRQSSRYPVYVHTLDNIVGIVHAKNFLLDKHLSVKDLIIKPFFVPESMKIDDLLTAMQKKKTHMAVVTDEYGVTSGVVTIEDILEEIVGEIRDELDFEAPKIRMVDQKKHEVDGLARIDEVNEAVGLNIETDEVDTIGGYFVLMLGKIPQAGDSIEVDGFLLTVNDVSNNRITKLTIETRGDKA